MPPDDNRLQGMRANVTDDIIRQTIQKAAELDCPVLVHAEDYEGCACGMQTAREKGQDGLAAWSASRHPQHEAKAIRAVCGVWTAVRLPPCILFI